MKTLALISSIFLFGTVIYSQTQEFAPSDQKTEESTQKGIDFTPFDVIYKSSNNDEIKAHIDYFYHQLINDPDPATKGVIVNYGTDREVADRIARIKKAVKSLRYRPSRFKFIRGKYYDGIRTEMYIAYAGADLRMLCTALK